MTSLSEGRYVITCDSGEQFTFSGTPDGANTIGDYICPKGSTRAVTSTTGRQVVMAIPVEDALAGRGTDVRAVLTGKAPAARVGGYPPYGYPCLGCGPCPPPAGAYCDTNKPVKTMVVAPIGPVTMPGDRGGVKDNAAVVAEPLNR